MSAAVGQLSGPQAPSLSSKDEKATNGLGETDHSNDDYSSKEKEGSFDPALDVVNFDAGVDVAADLVAGSHADDAIDPEVAARVRRKIDWQLLPLLFLLYTGKFDSHSTYFVTMLVI